MRQKAKLPWDRRLAGDGPISDGVPLPVGRGGLSEQNARTEPTNSGDITVRIRRPVLNTKPGVEG